MSRVYTNRICGINIENSIASKSKGLNATIGVFFDGTGNNLYNIGSITNRGGTSSELCHWLHFFRSMRKGTSSELYHWLHFVGDMRNADGQTGAVFLLVKSGWARYPV